MNSAGDSVVSASVAVTLPAVTGNRMALAGTVFYGDTFGSRSIVGTGSFYADETLTITTATSRVSDLFGDVEFTAVTTYYGEIAQNMFTSNGTTSVNTLSSTWTAFFPIGVAAGTSPVFSADVCSGLPGRWGTVGEGSTGGYVLTASSAGGPDCQAPEAPSAPQITNTDYGDGEIYLTVSDSGSSPVASYNATCTADGTSEYTGTSSTSRITVSGLTNGVGYSCTVTATNAAGTSTPSASSPPIVPEYIPTGLPIWLLFEASK